jgi:hypothetical protein
MSVETVILSLDQIQKLVHTRSYTTYALDDRSHPSDPLAPWVFVACRWRIDTYPVGHCSSRRGDTAGDGTGSLKTTSCTLFCNAVSCA